MQKPIDIEISFSNRDAQIIFGSYDQNLKLLEDLLGVELFARGNRLKLKGEKFTVEKASAFFETLKKKVQSSGSLTHQHIIDILAHGKHPAIPLTAVTTEDIHITKTPHEEIFVKSRKEFVYPRGTKQKNYIKAIRNYDLSLGIGPAGTGKTYLAVALAIESLKKGMYSKVVLTRPALEAGERLGFLPGDLEEKIKPYLQPIYDALFDIMKYEELKRWTEQKIIEIIPLAYMRGRTLNEAFIILDEAQNTTGEQMKMFLTRLGMNSRAVITGDVTQIDLPLTRQTSGLVVCEKILKNVKGIKFIYFTEKDVVRHNLVKKIIKAYAKYHEKTGPKDIADKQPEKN